MHNRHKGNLSLLAVGALFGISAVLAKYFAAYIDPYQVVMYRFAIALLCLALLTALFRYQLSLPRAEYARVGYFTVAFAVSVLFFTLAIFNTSVSLAVFSFYAATLISSYWIGYYLFSEGLNRYKQIALGLTFLALILFTKPFSDFSLELGFVFGLLAGVLQAVTSMYQKQLSQTCSRVSLLFAQTIGGTVLAAAAVVYFGGSLLVSLPTLPLVFLIFFGVAFLLISYLFLVGFKYANLNTGSVLISTELLFAPAFAFLLLAEVPSREVFFGGVVMIASLYFIYRADA